MPLQVVVIRVEAHARAAAKEYVSAFTFSPEVRAALSLHLVYYIRSLYPIVPGPILCWTL